MKTIYSFLILISIYLIVQGISLKIGLNFIPKISSGEIPPAVQEPEKAETSGEIFLYILFITLIFIFLLKLNLGIIIKILMSFAMFTGISITFWSFFPFPFWIALSVLFYLIFILKRENIVISNLALILTIAGIGGYLGASLHFIPSLLLLLILSAYDIIAVFGTKHMVTLATEAKDKIPMFSVPIKERFLGIGTGDLAIPSMFTVSILQDFSFLHSLFTIFGGLIGLISLFLFILKKERVTLPALPPITIGLFLGFLLGFILL